MPLYDFDVIDDGLLTRHDFGTESADFEDARQRARCILPEIARADLPFGDGRSFVCEVRDETGRVV